MSYSCFITAVPPYQGPDHGAAACPGPFTHDLALSAELVITSPNYGSAQYENNMDCCWLITQIHTVVSELITTAPGQASGMHFTEAVVYLWPCRNWLKYLGLNWVHINMF